MPNFSLITASGNKYIINATLAPAKRKGFAVLSLYARPDNFLRPGVSISGEVSAAEISLLSKECEKIETE